MREGESGGLLDGFIADHSSGGIATLSDRHVR
jgi:hypothetical protein